MAPLSVSGEPLHLTAPIQSRAMDKSDIRDLRRWQVAAAKRAKRAGFDLVYVYAGHGYLPFQFLSHRHNRRSNGYGGGLENRVRLLREMLEETKEAVGDTMAVAMKARAMVDAINPYSMAVTPSSAANRSFKLRWWVL